VIRFKHVNTIKNRLDRFQANQESVDNYENTLTGTGNRNFVDDDVPTF